MDPLEEPKWKSDYTNVVKNVEKLELSHPPDDNVQWH